MINTLKYSIVTLIVITSFCNGFGQVPNFLLGVGARVPIGAQCSAELKYHDFHSSDFSSDRQQKPYSLSLLGSADISYIYSVGIQFGHRFSYWPKKSIEGRVRRIFFDTQMNYIFGGHYLVEQDQVFSEYKYSSSTLLSCAVGVSSLEWYFSDNKPGKTRYIGFQAKVGGQFKLGGRTQFELLEGPQRGWAEKNISHITNTWFYVNLGFVWGVEGKK